MKDETLSSVARFCPGQYVQLCQLQGHPYSGRVGKIFCRQGDRLFVELSMTKQGDGSELVISPIKDWAPVLDIFVETYMSSATTYAWRLRGTESDKI